MTLAQPATARHPEAFHGVWPALLTPLDSRLDIDHPALAAHCQRLLTSGCGGVTLFGTTGEGTAFSMDERIDTLDRLIAAGVPARHIIVSTSCAALPETLALTRHAVGAGVHGCLMLPPFFLKGVSDAGIIDSYRYVIDGVQQSSLPHALKLYLYHIPQVSGIALSHHVIGTLKNAYPDIVIGVKDSACTTAQSVALAETFMDRLAIYVGYEPDLPEMGRHGSQGAISGLANFMPRLVERLVLQHDAPGTAAGRARVLELLALLAPYSLMPALKGVMAIVTGDPGWLRVRAPLVALSAHEFAGLTEAMRGFRLDAQTD